MMSTVGSSRFVKTILKISAAIICVSIGIFSIYDVKCIEPGQVGITVTLVGEDKGVQDVTVKTGYTIYNQWTSKIFEYPTSLQRKVYQDVGFQAKGGTSVSADLSVHYTIPPAKAPHVFVKLRGDKEVLDEYIFSCLRKVLQKEASEMSINDIYADGKNRMIESAKIKLEEELEGLVEINLLGFNGAIKLPDNIIAAINTTIEAEQRAIAAENKVAEAKAIADQKIETAKGEAESITLKADADAEANKKINASITPELVKYKALEKWDGKLPNVTGGAVPFIEVK